MKISPSSPSKTKPTTRTISLTIMALLTVGAIWKFSPTSKSSVPILAHNGRIEKFDFENIPEETVTRIADNLKAAGVFSSETAGTVDTFALSLYKYVIPNFVLRGTGGRDFRHFKGFIVDGWKDSTAWKSFSEHGELDQQAFMKFSDTLADVYQRDHFENEEERRVHHTVRALTFGGLDHMARNFVSLIETGEYFDYDTQSHVMFNIHDTRGREKNMIRVLKKFVHFFGEWSNGLYDFFYNKEPTNQPASVPIPPVL